MSSVLDTKQCPHCGHANDIGRSVCEVCNNPLTTYGAQVKGASEEDVLSRKKRIEILEVRPPGATVATVFNVLFALFGPIAIILGAMSARPHVNASGTNYMAAATGAIGPVFALMFFGPIALGLFAAAWAAWNQISWGWTGTVIAASVCILYGLFRGSPVSIIWLAAGAVMFYFLFRPQTRVWYGHIPPPR